MCRPKSQGGRRCPSHSDPIRIAARNAKRREAYKQTRSEILDKVAVERAVGENVPNALARSSFAKNFLNQQLTDDKKISDLFSSKAQHIESKKINITSSENEGELVEKNYFSSKNANGTINYNNLDSDSYKEFGFHEINKDSVYYKDRKMKMELEEFRDLSKLEIKDFNKDDIAAVRFFTSNDYEWFNNAIYSKGKSLSVHTVDRDTDDPFEDVKKEYDRIYIDDMDRSKKMVNRITEKLDEALAKGPKIQRIVYRGKKAGSKAFNGYENVEEWVDKNAKLGQEVKFDGYQSTTADIEVASLSLYSGGYEPGLIYEILTPEGANITHLSNYADEKEVLLPRDSRYMVVGIHKNQEKNKYEQQAHIIQLVAINDKGEILTGENSSPKDPIFKDEAKEDV